MAKLGVYVCTHNNPFALRALVTQVLALDRKPDVLAIYKNGPGDDYRWVIEDLEPSLDKADIKLLYRADNYHVQAPRYYMVPLRMLMTEECDLYTKMDDDDIFFTNHLRVLEGMFVGPHDWAVNINGHVLESYPDKLYHLEKDMVWYWNPTGGPSDAVMFTAKAATEYYRALLNSVGTPDDVVMGRVMEGMKVLRLTQGSTMCYVSHGRNTSGPIANNDLYVKQKQERRVNQ